MDYIFKEWKEALDKFHDSIEKDLAEVRRQKAAVQRIKVDIINELESGRYIRDDKRIVISAPEIIIGNVDKSGQLWDNGPSRIIIRGTSIGVEASGPGGSIDNKATTIRNLAVDPGIDGMESVVYPESAIMSKARSISLATERSGETFVSGFAASTPGISLISDTKLSLVSAMGNTSAKKRADSAKKTLDAQYKELKSQLSASKSRLGELLNQMDKSMKSLEGLTDDDMTTRGNIAEIISYNNELEKTAPQMYGEMKVYSGLLSALAEIHRQIQCMDNYSTGIDKLKSSYKDNPTGAFIDIASESISVNTLDGDGNIRENDGAGIFVNSPRYNITSIDSKGALIKGGSFKVNNENISFQTADYDIKDEKNATALAKGHFSIMSKNIIAAAVDIEKKDDKVSEKALTDKGVITLRAENINLLGTDTEGKSSGNAQINAKTIAIKSMDVDKEKRSDKQMTAGSTMVLLSEKIYEGATDNDKNKSKQLQIASEKIGLFAKTTAEIQQDKATVQLDGGNLNIGGGKTAVFGDTTVNGKTDFKADIKAPKASIDNVEAKSSFKSTNISDGIAVPGAPSSATLSAKLKEENAPKNEKK